MVNTLVTYFATHVLASTPRTSSTSSCWPRSMSTTAIGGRSASKTPRALAWSPARNALLPRRRCSLTSAGSAYPTTRAASANDLALSTIRCEGLLGFHPARPFTARAISWSTIAVRASGATSSNTPRTSARSSGAVIASRALLKSGSSAGTREGARRPRLLTAFSGSYD